MVHPVLRRALSVVAASSLTAGMIVVLTPGGSLAVADPVGTAVYSATANADMLAVDATLVGASVANLRLGANTATANAQPQGSAATASNIRAAVLGALLPQQSVTQSAPPDNTSANTAGFDAVSLPPLLALPLIDASAQARSAADNNSCLASGALLSHSTTSVAKVTVGQGVVPPLGAGAPLLGNVADVGAIQASGSTSLVALAGANPKDIRAAQSQTTSLLSSIGLLGNVVHITVAGTSTLTAKASGVVATSGATFTPALVTVTVNGVVTPFNGSGQLVIPLDLRVAGTGLLAKVTLNLGTLTGLINTGTAVSASASLLTAAITVDTYALGIKVASIADVSLNVSPMTVLASAPSSGVQCLAPPTAPVITSPGNGDTVTTHTPPISGTGTTGDTITVTSGGNPVCGPVTVKDGVWMCTPTSPIPNGPITVIATETNPAGSTDSTPVTFIVATIEPPPVITSPVTGSIVNNGTVAFTGTGIATHHVTVFEGTGALCSATVDASGDWHCSPTAGLTVGPHTVYAVQTNPVDGDVSVDSNLVTFTTAIIGTQYVPLTPYRVLDTRAATRVGPTTGPIVARHSVRLSATQLRIAAGEASAVVLNLTVDAPAKAGFVTAYPSDQTQPVVSSSNYAKGQTRANLVIVPVAADGSVTIYTNQQTQLVADVFGYFATHLLTDSGGLFHALTPKRLLDTRVGGNHALAPNTTRVLAVSGHGGVPSTGVGSVVLNVTVSRPTGRGYVSAFPTGEAFHRSTSNVNFVKGDLASTRVIVPLGTNGSVSFYNFLGSTTELVVDVTGYFSKAGAGDFSGAQFVAVDPERVIDTRPPAVNTAASPLHTRETRTLQLTGEVNVPTAGTVSVVANVTAVTPTHSGYLTQYATGTAKPFVSDVNFVAGEIVPNLALSGINGSGNASVYNFDGNTNLIEDVAGYFRTIPAS